LAVEGRRLGLVAPAPQPAKGLGTALDEPKNLSHPDTSFQSPFYCIFTIKLSEKYERVVGSEQLGLMFSKLKPVLRAALSLLLRPFAD
jgi:hypothetical protein